MKDAEKKRLEFVFAAPALAGRGVRAEPRAFTRFCALVSAANARYFWMAHAR